MEVVEGVLQHYAWGDLDAIAHLTGRAPSGLPEAELWFGTHPAAPAHLHDGRSLLGHAGTLSFLVKVLAAARPLSLQVHPSDALAVEGFRRENAAGIDLNSPSRIYRDPYAKPEILIALGRFEALCGLAPIEQTINLLAEIGSYATELRQRLASGGPAAVIAHLLIDRPSIQALAAAARSIDDPRCRWLASLAVLHPNDPSAAISLLLNHVTLGAGQAIFLGPGNLHAYLNGVGVEILASSDNVVRCGLTSKHVDAQEVLRVIDPTPLLEPIVTPIRLEDGGWHYPTPTSEFHVTRYDVNGQLEWFASSPELLFCAAGSVSELRTGQCSVVLKGQRVNLEGHATIFRVRRPGGRR
jgi:mannose-6-phosphate isomerase